MKKKWIWVGIGIFVVGLMSGLLLNSDNRMLIKAKLTGGYVNCMPTVRDDTSFTSAHQGGSEGIAKGEPNPNAPKKPEHQLITLCDKARWLGIKTAW